MGLSPARAPWDTSLTQRSRRPLPSGSPLHGTLLCCETLSSASSRESSTLPSCTSPQQARSAVSSLSSTSGRLRQRSALRLGLWTSLRSRTPSLRTIVLLPMMCRSTTKPSRSAGAPATATRAKDCVSVLAQRSAPSLFFALPSP
eukprot:Amastigsp_a340893_26.p5 type:complete len:145 gc:universal Amastigsp_a340893_26:974-540(-)